LAEEMTKTRATLGEEGRGGFEKSFPSGLPGRKPEKNNPLAKKKKLKYFDKRRGGFLSKEKKQSWGGIWGKQARRVDSWKSPFDVREKRSFTWKLSEKLLEKVNPRAVTALSVLWKIKKKK